MHIHGSSCETRAEIMQLSRSRLELQGVGASDKHTSSKRPSLRLSTTPNLQQHRCQEPRHFLQWLAVATKRDSLNTGSSGASIQTCKCGTKHCLWPPPAAHPGISLSLTHCHSQHPHRLPSSLPPTPPAVGGLPPAPAQRTCPREQAHAATQYTQSQACDQSPTLPPQHTCTNTIQPA